MSFFSGSRRTAAIISDEDFERYVAAIRADLDPDPLFRRRLRGQLVNHYVAAREGHGQRRGINRDMGRLGRAVLYSSFALGLSVTSVMAASQRAIPGQPLYPLKLQIEDLRVQALPSHLQDELAAYSLGQRIEELHRLAEAGEWGLVTDQAVAIELAYGSVLAARGDSGAANAHVTIISGLIERMPDSTRTAVENVMSGMPGIGQKGAPGSPGSPNASGSGPGGNVGGVNNEGSNANGSTNPGGANNDGSSGNAPHRPRTTDGSDRGSNLTEPDEAEPSPTASSKPTTPPTPITGPSESPEAPEAPEAPDS